jgi:hypothetical protein
MLRIPIPTSIFLHDVLLCVMCCVVFGVLRSVGYFQVDWACLVLDGVVFCFLFGLFLHCIGSVGFGILMWYGINMVMTLLHYL